jgi:hypothetical protein
VSAASWGRAASRRLPDALALSDAFSERPEPVCEVGASSLAGSSDNGTVGQQWT